MEHNYGNTPKTMAEAGDMAELTEKDMDKVSGGATWYTVKAGDTLMKIAARYGTSYKKLMQANGIINPDQIKVGQKIRIVF